MVFKFLSFLNNEKVESFVKVEKIETRFDLIEQRK